MRQPGQGARLPRAERVGTVLQLELVVAGLQDDALALAGGERDRQVRVVRGNSAVATVRPPNALASASVISARWSIVPERGGELARVRVEVDRARGRRADLRERAGRRRNRRGRGDERERVALGDLEPFGGRRRASRSRPRACGSSSTTRVAWRVGLERADGRDLLAVAGEGDEGGGVHGAQDAAAPAWRASTSCGLSRVAAADVAPPHLQAMVLVLPDVAQLVGDQARARPRRSGT